MSGGNTSVVCARGKDAQLNAFDDGEVTCLLRNEEKCISIKKSILTAIAHPPGKRPFGKYVHWEFKDSFLFLSSSLDNLSKSLSDEDFAPLEKFWERLGVADEETSVSLSFPKRSRTFETQRVGPRR